MSQKTALMTSVYLKLSLPILLLFTATILLIHLQPYDDTELRALLTPPDGCPAPCFMGIRPGVTSADEAEQILKAHPWIKYVPARPRYNGYTIEFIWNGKQPKWIGNDSLTGVGIVNGKVTNISLYLNRPLGEFQLVYGPPDWSTFSILSNGKAAAYSSVYWGQSIGATVLRDCPLSNIWNTAYTVVWYKQNDIETWQQAPMRKKSPNAMDAKC
jgi:hypothetical protein